jgi:hypothetical protein
MQDSLSTIHLIAGPTPPIVFTVAAVAALVLLASRRWRRWLPIAVAAIVVGFLLGLLLCWVLGDLLDLFSVSLSVSTRVWAGVGVAGLTLGIARAVFSGRWFIAVGVVSALILALAGALGVNADLGEYPTVGDVLGKDSFPALVLPHGGPPVTVADWVAPAGMPAAGRVGSVQIVGTHSHFHARDALVYLPPAALVVHPPTLPVLELMAGQPGGPADLFTKGHLAATLDAYASAHGGLAPIVVVPDQLGAPARNPMCVDSQLGNSATYLTVDVPNWVHAHLAALSGAAGWGIGGFSQGGTCSIQFGARLPAQYGTIVDISGESAPISGTPKETIDTAFAGSRTAWLAASAANLLLKNGPYTHTLGIFIAGAADTRYGPQLRLVEQHAREAGMRTTLLISPGTAHDWNTVQFAFNNSLPLVAHNWGLDG